MKVNTNWYNGIKKQIELLENSLSEKDYKKFKLHLLLCVAERVDQFSSECGQCEIFKQDVTTLIQDVGNLAQIADKAWRKAYFKSMNKVIGHLQRQHKLVTEGYYIGVFMAIGSGLGVALGAAMDEVGGGIPIGVGIGVALGAALDYKARKEGRVLCPRETTGFSWSSSKLLLVILSIVLLAGLVAFLLIRR